jgi:hypothetical protein
VGVPGEERLRDGSLEVDRATADSVTESHCGYDPFLIIPDEHEILSADVWTFYLMQRTSLEKPLLRDLDLDLNVDIVGQRPVAGSTPLRSRVGVQFVALFLQAI